MVVGPRIKSVPGYDRKGEGVDTAIPYVMWKDTQYEHADGSDPLVGFGMHCGFGSIRDISVQPPIASVRAEASTESTRNRHRAAWSRLLALLLSLASSSYDNAASTL